MQMQPGLQDKAACRKSLVHTGYQCWLKHQHIACGWYVPHRTQYLRISLGGRNYHLGLRGTARNIQLIFTVIKHLIFLVPLFWLFYI